MNNFTIYLATLLCLLASKVLGQETFETRAKNIATKIETITKEEKSALKEEVEAVNNQLEKGSITLEQAENKKKVLAEARVLASDLTGLTNLALSAGTFQGFV